MRRLDPGCAVVMVVAMARTSWNWLAPIDGEEKRPLIAVEAMMCCYRALARWEHTASEVEVRTSGDGSYRNCIT